MAAERKWLCSAVIPHSCSKCIYEMKLYRENEIHFILIKSLTQTAT